MFCVQMMLALTATLMWLFQPSQSCLTMPSFVSRISWTIALFGIVFWLHFVIEESKLELRLSRGDNEMSSIVLQRPRHNGMMSVEECRRNGGWSAEELKWLRTQNSDPTHMDKTDFRYFEIPFLPYISHSLGKQLSWRYPLSNLSTEPCHLFEP